MTFAETTTGYPTEEQLGVLTASEGQNCTSIALDSGTLPAGWTYDGAPTTISTTLGYGNGATGGDPIKARTTR